MYRPQFPYKSAPECEDQRCVYCFDATNTPFLRGILQPGDSISRIPLLLDKDADFYLRGFSTESEYSGIEFRLEDPKGHALSDIENFRVDINYQFFELYSATEGAGIVALDSDDWGIYCQQGSRLYLYVLNNNAGSPFDLTSLIFNLHGIKRYSGDRCAA